LVFEAHLTRASRKTDVQLMIIVINNEGNNDDIDGNDIDGNDID